MAANGIYVDTGFPQIKCTSLAVGAELLTALYNHFQYLGELRGAGSSRKR